jgi:hypothetical protein
MVDCAGTFLAFGAAGRLMATEAAQHREVLVKHGLAATVLEEFVQRLDQFDAAVSPCNAGRTAHRGATAEIKAVAAGIFRAVRVMDGRNRQRFPGDQQSLETWGSAQTVGRRRGANLAHGRALAVTQGALARGWRLAAVSCGCTRVASTGRPDRGSCRMRTWPTSRTSTRHHDEPGHI